jgi:hypothetical protein
MSRIIIPVVSFAAFLGFTLAMAQAQDPLADFRARQKAAQEKLVGQVDKAIADSRKMDPKDAKFLLQVILRQVKDTDMLPEQRNPLVQRLTTRLTQVDQGEAGVKVGQDQKSASDPPRKKFQIPDQPSGGSSGGVSAFAKDFTGGMKAAAKSNADLIQNREKNIVAVNRGIEESHVPSDKEINFPRNWKAISERRKEMVSQKLTAQEAKLLKTLNSTMSVNYDGDEFKAVINHLQDRTGLGIIIDEASIRDLNIDYADKVSFKVEKASVRTILKKVLGDKGLTYIIKEGNIQVMTPKRASEYAVVRSYPIGDLITPVQANAMFNPFMQQFQKQQNAQQVINLIIFMTGQDYWQPNGPGSISYFAPSDALLIRASAEMHYQLASPGLFGR